MFNLTSSTPKTWQTVSRQADRAAVEHTVPNAVRHVPTVHELGGVLRERREAMGASLAEVETATRIRQKYLAAMESDDWHLLPGEIVGRGFLRNYATYLGLDPTELVERRRVVADPSVASTLAGTSAGSAMPPERNVDYRPKDVALKDEQEGIQQRELRLGAPVRRLLGLFGVLFLLWLIVSTFGAQITTGLTNAVAGVQTTVANVQATPTLAITPDLVAANQTGSTQAGTAANPNNVAGAPLINSASNAPTENTGQANPAATPAAQPPVENNNGNPNAVAALASTPVGPTPTATTAVRRLLIPTATPAADTSTADQVAAPAAADGPVDSAAAAVDAAPTPTNPPEPTPTLVLPTATTEPLPTDTPEPTPTEAPPAVVAPACADARSAIFSPGVNQVLSGPVAVTGRAAHESFQYYKLEYAPGADAGDGYTYFDGANSAVDGGTLGILNTGSLPNGVYTLQLTVVDMTANYPPPCRVTITIQN